MSLETLEDQIDRLEETFDYVIKNSDEIFIDILGRLEKLEEDEDIIEIVNEFPNVLKRLSRLEMQQNGDDPLTYVEDAMKLVRETDDMFERDKIIEKVIDTLIRMRGK